MTSAARSGQPCLTSRGEIKSIQRARHVDFGQDHTHVEPGQQRALYGAKRSDLLAVHELSAAIQARRLSPVDLVEAYLARIEVREPKLRAFVEVYAEDARLAAG